MTKASLSRPAQSIAEGWASALAAYRPMTGIPDECLDADGHLRAPWRRFFEDVRAGDMGRAVSLAERHIRDLGISYRVRDEARERPWPVTGLPVLIGEAEWSGIAAAVAQRANLIEAVLADVYGAGRLIADGLLPAAVVAGAQEFLRPLVGVTPPGKRWMNLYAADIGRGPDGRWWVLADRAQAPSGAGYALENRLAISRALSQAYAHLNVQRLAPFFRAFRSGLAAAAERSEPRIGLMAAGPFSPSYSEQSYLARYLGFLLVEGDDLVVHEDKVHVRTIAGLKRADVLWRRVDADFIDPLELNDASRLGVPRLLSAIRAGKVVVANMPGAGFAETRALMSFLPRLSRHILGEDLAMPNIATWWCGQEDARRMVLDNLETMAIAGALAAGVPGFEGAAPIVPESASGAEKARLAAAIAGRGVDYVGQELVRLSTTPVWQNGKLVPRPFALRVFAAAGPDGWTVMPGGFCLISDKADARAVSMGDGVQSADVWVMSGRPVAAETLLPAQDKASVRRVLGNLPSRAADNLFWFGRYLERTEAVLRIVRCLCAKSIDLDASQPESTAAFQRMRKILVAWGAAPEARQGATLLSDLAAALAGEDDYGSALNAARRAYGAASVIRERLSTDSWKLLGALERQIGTRPEEIVSIAEAHDHADRALTTLAALSGLAQENINRVAGWRFIDIGRRVERAINTCRFVRTFAGEDATADDLDLLLDLIDSQITYRSRYLAGLSLTLVRDMAMLDPFNPRSIAFQVEALRGHVEKLPSLLGDGLPEEPRRIIEKLAGEVISTSAEDIRSTSVLMLEQTLMRFAETIAARYFLRREDGRRAEGASGLA